MKGADRCEKKQECSCCCWPARLPGHTCDYYFAFCMRIRPLSLVLPYPEGKVMNWFACSLAFL